MLLRLSFSVVFMFAITSASSVSADIIDLTPADINGGDSSTAQFSNADVTLTPFQGGVQATFNGGADRLGIDDQAGTNVNAFNDLDQIAGNGDDESLEFSFAANAGLAGFSWDFSRADGPLPTDGVNISGFLTNPMASFTGDAGVVSSYSNGVLNLQLSSAEFKGADTIMTLGVTGASAGQTLVMTVNDSTQGGSQLAITGISYDNATFAVPEPASATCLVLIGMTAFSQRRRR